MDSYPPNGTATVKTVSAGALDLPISLVLKSLLTRTILRATRLYACFIWRATL
jgi:hypothetical protein